MKIHDLDRYLLNTDLGIADTTVNKTDEDPDLKELPFDENQK